MSTTNSRRRQIEAPKKWAKVTIKFYNNQYQSNQNQLKKFEASDCTISEALQALVKIEKASRRDVYLTGPGQRVFVE